MQNARESASAPSTMTLHSGMRYQVCGAERTVCDHECGINEKNEPHGTVQNVPKRLALPTATERDGYVEVELTSVSHGEYKQEQAALCVAWEYIEIQQEER